MSQWDSSAINAFVTKIRIKNSNINSKSPFYCFYKIMKRFLLSTIWSFLQQNILGLIELNQWQCYRVFQVSCPDYKSKYISSLEQLEISWKYQNVQFYTYFFIIHYLSFFHVILFSVNLAIFS